MSQDLARNMPIQGKQCKAVGISQGRHLTCRWSSRVIVSSLEGDSKQLQLAMLPRLERHKAASAVEMNQVMHLAPWYKTYKGCEGNTGSKMI